MAVKRKRLPPIPKEIHTVIGAVPVERPDVLLNEDGSASDDMGEVNYHTRVIGIRKGLSLAAAWQTLEHERVHLILLDAGVKLPSELEETICDVMATARVADMTAQLSKG